jgi:hypothetical protein
MPELLTSTAEMCSMEVPLGIVRSELSSVRPSYDMTEPMQPWTAWILVGPSVSPHTLIYAATH